MIRTTCRLAPSTLKDLPAVFAAFSILDCEGKVWPQTPLEAIA
jgi:hypothetical protein